MSAYEKRGGFGGKGRPSFKKNFDAPRKLYSATCAECNDRCEVPFRPNGERPVFCKNCFDKQAPQDGFDRREAPRRDSFRGNSYDSFREKPRREAFDRPASAPADRGVEELKSQIIGMNRKLDTVVSLLAEVAASLQGPKVAPKDLGAVVKKVVKKTAAKKKVA